MELSAAVYGDASAAPDLMQRRGIGKVRHNGTQCLWLQEAHATKRLAFENIGGTRNSSGLFTKHLCELLVDRRMMFIGATAESGRAKTAAELSLLDIPKLYMLGCRVIDQDVLHMSEGRRDAMEHDNDNANKQRQLMTTTTSQDGHVMATCSLRKTDSDGCSSKEAHSGSNRTSKPGASCKRPTATVAP